VQLKEYQQRALAEIRSYLEHLSSWKKKADANPDLPRAQASEETIMKAAVS
jgi:hypothetical protein